MITQQPTRQDNINGQKIDLFRVYIFLYDVFSCDIFNVKNKSQVLINKNYNINNKPVLLIILLGLSDFIYDLTRFLKSYNLIINRFFFTVRRQLSTRRMS